MTKPNQKYFNKTSRTYFKKTDKTPVIAHEISTEIKKKHSAFCFYTSGISMIVWIKLLSILQKRSVFVVLMVNVPIQLYLVSIYNIS